MLNFKDNFVIVFVCVRSDVKKKKGSKDGKTVNAQIFKPLTQHFIYLSGNITSDNIKNKINDKNKKFLNENFLKANVFNFIVKYI